MVTGDCAIKRHNFRSPLYFGACTQNPRGATVRWCGFSVCLVLFSKAADHLCMNWRVDSARAAARYANEAFGIIWEKPMTVVLRFRADQGPYVAEREWHSTQLAGWQSRNDLSCRR